MTSVELFDPRDASELSPAAELRASEALRLAVPRAALVISTITRRTVSGQLTRFELLEGDEVATDGCDVFAITVAVPPAPGAAATRHPLGAAVVPRHSVTGLAELLMGGPGEGEDRVPTRFERSLLCRHLAEALVAVWEGLAVNAAEPPCLTWVDHPVPELPVSAVAVGVSFTRGERSWDLTLALSAALVDAGADPLPPAGMSMARAVKDVPVDLAARFLPTVIRASELERIAAGDVIRLDHAVTEPLIGVVEGRPLLRLRPGTTGRRLAVEVSAMLGDDGAAATASSAPAGVPVPATVALPSEQHQYEQHHYEQHEDL